MQVSEYRDNFLGCSLSVGCVRRLRQSVFKLTLESMAMRVLSSPEKPLVPVPWQATFKSQAVLRRLMYASPEILPRGLDSVIPSFVYISQMGTSVI